MLIILPRTIDSHTNQPSNHPTKTSTPLHTHTHTHTTAMLKQYVRHVLAGEGTCVARVRLIAKAHNLGLYQRCGFRILRLSPVVHGKDSWFEMGLGACVPTYLRMRTGGRIKIGGIGPPTDQHPP